MTNWEYLMGTPALAAQFIYRACSTNNCMGCPLEMEDVNCDDWRDLKAWLEREMD